MGNKAPRFLVADDSPDDRYLIQSALDAGTTPVELEFVTDGEQLLEYLRREADYASLAGQALPDLLLLDLNMPKMGGREALSNLRSTPELERIQVIVLTTSSSADDIAATEAENAYAFVTKPDSFEELTSTLGRIAEFMTDAVNGRWKLRSHGKTVGVRLRSLLKSGLSKPYAGRFSSD